MSCKVRFAPSPTGFMHIGNARIAIINYLFCKKNDGKFLFRIDDTDILRSKPEYETAIIADLNWLGIKYDETFRQSERLARYKEILEKLISESCVYKCYETPEELEYKRRMAASKGLPPVYDRAALKLTDAEKHALEDAGTPYCWRFKLPNKVISWKDLILGEISYDLSNVSDPVIMKTDGTYLYTFSSVIDDIDSGITHIIRGQDHVTNTAVQIAMFDAISNNTYKAEFAHLSLLINKDGSQFSKRLGSMNLQSIREHGVDPMAIFDLLATLGTSLDTVPFTEISDLISYFDITKFSSNSPKFDIDDILKLNRKIIHARRDDAMLEYGLSREAFSLIKDNLDSYNDIQTWVEILKPGYSPCFAPSASDRTVLEAAISELSAIKEIDVNSGPALINRIKTITGASGKALYMPLRLAVTGLEHGPNIIEIFAMLGRDEVLNRIRSSL